MKRNTKIIIGIVVAIAVVGGVGLTVLLPKTPDMPKTPDIQIGNWWEYSDGKREEVVGEEMVGGHDCWEVKSYSAYSDFHEYRYIDKKNLGRWKTNRRSSGDLMTFRSNSTYRPEPLTIKWPVMDRCYDTGITCIKNFKMDSETREILLKSFKREFLSDTGLMDNTESSIISIHQTYIGKEQITVPAGTFVCEHYRETTESDSGGRTWNIWFSPDVWNVVRIEYGGGEIKELVDYHK